MTMSPEAGAGGGRGASRPSGPGRARSGGGARGMVRPAGQGRDRVGPQVIAPRGTSTPSGEQIDRERPATAGALAQAISLVLAVVAVATWASPLSASSGRRRWDSAVRLALPLTLGLQWMIWSRHLGRDDGLGSLRRESPVTVAVLAIGRGVLARARPRRRGRRPIAGDLGRRIRAREPGMGALVCASARLCRRRSRGRPARAPVAGRGRLRHARRCRSRARHQRPGHHLGRALVARRSERGRSAPASARCSSPTTTIGWGFHGALPALALIPSTVGGFWGGPPPLAHLRRACRGRCEAYRPAAPTGSSLRSPALDDPRRLRRYGSRQRPPSCQPPAWRPDRGRQARSLQPLRGLRLSRARHAARQPAGLARAPGLGAARRRQPR